MTAEAVAGLFVLIFWLMIVGACVYGGVCMWRDSLVADTSVEKVFGTGLILVGLALLVIPIAYIVLPHSPMKPCVRQETMMQYNAATKTTALVTYCAQYGEWVTE